MQHLLLFLLFCAASAAPSALAHPGQHEQLERVTRALEQAPAEQSLYIQRGSIHSTSGDFDAARADFERAEQLGPAVLVALEWGLLYYRRGDFQRADQYLADYLEHFPSEASAWEYRARAARDAGNGTQALDCYKRYFELLERPHPGNYLSAANMLNDTGAPDKALALLDDGMARLGPVPQLQRRAVELEIARGNTPGAIDRQVSLGASLNENPAWKVAMAELLVLDGQTDRARDLLSRAQEELSTLRPTPARAALVQRANELAASLPR